MRTNSSRSSRPTSLIAAGGSTSDKDALAQGFRWHGARLAAGLVHVEDAAWALDVRVKNLLAIEAGTLSAGRRLLDLLPKVYGVSPFYPADGAQSEREQFADRLARLIERASADEYSERIWWPKRLARIQTQIGPPFEDEFYNRLGSLFPNYVRSQIDATSEWAMRATIDLQIGLCLAMGAMPEYGVLSQLPIWPLASQAATWWRPLDEQNFSYLELPIESEDWAWLDHGASYRDEMSLQIVEFDGRSFQVSDDERLQVSRLGLPAAGAAAGGSLYAIRGEVAGRRMTVVLDPERGNGDCAIVDWKGKLSIGINREPNVPSLDPIQFPLNGHTAGSLGRIVARL